MLKNCLQNAVDERRFSVVAGCFFFVARRKLCGHFNGLGRTSRLHRQPRDWDKPRERNVTGHMGETDSRGLARKSEKHLPLTALRLMGVNRVHEEREPVSQ